MTKKENAFTMFRSCAWAALGLVALASCTGSEKTPIQYMPHMANTSILKAQRGYGALESGTSMLQPPEHTVPIGKKPYRIATVEEAEAKLRNPLPMNRIMVERGRQIYNIYCSACHGVRGHGDGPVVNPYPIPKSLHSADMRRWNDGHLFHVITMGQGVMPSYAEQVAPEDRWAVIHYVRVLQRAENPTEEDIRELKKLTGKK